MLIEGLQIPIGIQPVNPLPVDSWSGPYNNVSEALSSIPLEVRFPTMEVRILSPSGNTMYWFRDTIDDSGLVLFGADLTVELNNEIINRISNDIELYNLITGETENRLLSDNELNNLKYDKTGGTVDGFIVASGFTGDGSGLYNIQASGVTGLNLDRISNGSNSAIMSASGLTVNTDITGNSFVKNGGSSSEFLMADGSLNVDTYSLSGHTHNNYLNLSGGTLTGPLILDHSLLNIINSVITGDSTDMVLNDGYIQLNSYGDYPVIKLNRASGTNLLPTTPDSGSLLGRIEFGAYNGSGFTISSKIEGVIDGVSGTSKPSRLVFYTTPNGGTQSNETFRIDSDGRVRVGSTMSLSDKLNVEGGSITLENGYGIKSLTPGVGGTPYSILYTENEKTIIKSLGSGILIKNKTADKDLISINEIGDSIINGTLIVNKGEDDQLSVIINSLGQVSGNTFIKRGGLGSEFLMADGSILTTGDTINIYDERYINITGDTIYGYLTASGFTGDGSGLYNIQASGVTGLNLDRISSNGNSAIMSASGLTVNTDTIIDGNISVQSITTNSSGLTVNLNSDLLDGYHINDITAFTQLNYVPYTGATKNVDLNSHTLKAVGFNVDTVTPYVVSNPGDIGWNNEDGTIDFRLLNNTTLQSGQELYFYGKATGNILNGDVVQFAGVQGNHFLVKKAVPSEINTNPEFLMGVSTANIANGDFGYVTCFGKINDVHTTGWTLDSPVLYFDFVTGGLTQTRPQAPTRTIIVASVIKLQTGNSENGKIFIRPSFGMNVTDLDDVDGTPLTANGQIMVWDNNRGVFDFTDNVNRFSDSGHTHTAANISFTPYIDVTGSTVQNAIQNVVDKINNLPITLQIKIISDIATLIAGNGRYIYTVPEKLNGYNLTSAHASITTASSSGSTSFQIYNLTHSVDILTTNITIDEGEYNSYTAIIPPVIGQNNNLLATGDRLRMDVDLAGVGVKGWSIILTFTKN